MLCDRIRESSVVESKEKSKAKTAEERHFYMTSCLIRMYCKKLQELINMPLLEEND
jgi:hypothetical protein